MNEKDFIRASKEHLKRLLKKEKLLDENLEIAFDKVPREKFLPSHNRSNAYQNNAFDIGFGQTISQPTMIFIMLKKLEVRKVDKVLEIGTGSGYVTALLCELSDFVYSIERIPDLAISAELRLREIGYTNFRIFVGDGSKGLPEYSPYDRIIVSAASPNIPKSLCDQLSDGGIMVLPIGGLQLQRLVVVKKFGSVCEVKEDVSCRFVPLIGEEGFKYDLH
ncbi:MAG: protein-L-isoaspartate(D-aspartate) O-methyltransferase [Brevinematia bacterium]